MQWISSRDKEVRDDHKDLDNDVIDLGKSFLADETLRFPHDPLASAEQTINCRCVIVADI